MGRPLPNRRAPWFPARRIDLGKLATRALRVASTGEHGWEMRRPIEMPNHLSDRLMAAGEAHGLALCGARAQNGLRRERTGRAFGADLGRDASPPESGLDRFVDRTTAFRGAAMEALGIRAPCATPLINEPAEAPPLRGARRCTRVARRAAG